MDISKGTWHARYYFFALALIDRFTDDVRNKHYDIRRRGTTDICHYVRVTCLWAPLIVLTYLGLIWLVVDAVAVSPLKYFGVLAYGKFWGFIGAIIGCFALRSAIVGVVDRLSTKISSLVRGVKRKRSEAAKTQGIAPPVSAREVLRQWFKDRKEKMCTTVRLVDVGAEGDHT